jgi:hypothetical protein
MITISLLFVSKNAKKQKIFFKQLELLCINCFRRRVVWMINILYQVSMLVSLYLVSNHYYYCLIMVGVEVSDLNIFLLFQTVTQYIRLSNSNRIKEETIHSTNYYYLISLFDVAGFDHSILATFLPIDSFIQLKLKFETLNLILIDSLRFKLAQRK